MAPAKTSSFNGFSADTCTFIEDLRQNNDKLWFDANKGRYEASVLDPSRAFVDAMGMRLRRIAPTLHAEPRVNRSLFRVHRDVRFARDKSPYKTHVGVWLWEGHGARMDCSGFYVHIDPPILMLGVGIHVFPKPHLEFWRETVADDRHGAAISEAVDEIRALDSDRGSYTIGGEHYKRVPRGYDPEHPRAALLKHNGLFGAIEMPVPAAFTSPDIVELCAGHFEALAPLHHGLLDMTRRMA